MLRARSARRATFFARACWRFRACENILSPRSFCLRWRRAHRDSTALRPLAPLPIIRRMQPRRLYLDNAATSFPKPKAVLDAMVRYATELGASAGRGAYAEAAASGGIINDCRRNLCRLFNGDRAEHFVFTLNCTDALNLSIKGLI